VECPGQFTGENDFSREGFSDSKVKTSMTNPNPTNNLGSFVLIEISFPKPLAIFYRIAARAEKGFFKNFAPSIYWFYRICQLKFSSAIFGGLRLPDGMPCGA
jgi:hypothetical protein